MGNDIAVFGGHREPACRQHRLRRFSFRSGINPDAQRVLADLARQLTLQIHGVESCDLAFDRAANQWVEYTVRTDRCPVGEEISHDAASAVLARLRAAELGEDYLAPCPSAATTTQIDPTADAASNEKHDRFGAG
jgi:hypothetical protein